MDVHRPDLAKRNRQRQLIIYLSVAVISVGLILSMLLYSPGPLKVERGLVQTAIVQSGEMRVEVAGIGSLVPAEVRWVAAQTAGRIEKILVLPGAQVMPDTIIMELSNTELLQTRDNLVLQLRSEEADFVGQKARLENSVLQMESQISELEANHKLAMLEAEITRNLYEEGLESQLSMKQSSLREEQLNMRLSFEKKRIEKTRDSIQSQIASELSRIEQTKARLKRVNDQINALKIRAGFPGVLQRQTVEEGQRVIVGQNLAQVTNPKSLKAVIEVPEHLAKDLKVGQFAQVDTRTSVINGSVVRVDPNVEEGAVAVDINFTEALPSGVRSDLTVEGKIEIFNFPSTVFVDRPSYAQSFSSKQLFKIDTQTDLAMKVDIQFGRVSVNTAQIESGLQPGDEVIISDTTDWDDQEQIQIY